MKKNNKIIFLVLLLLSCFEEDTPNGQECEKIKNEKSCYESNCSIFDSAFFGNITKESQKRHCRWDAEVRQICLQAEIRDQESVISYWGRQVSNDTIQLMVLFHNYNTNEIDGWLRCASPMGSSGQIPGTIDCSCDLGEKEPPLN